MPSSLRRTPVLYVERACDHRTAITFPKYQLPASSTVSCELGFATEYYIRPCPVAREAVQPRTVEADSVAEPASGRLTDDA